MSFAPSPPVFAGTPDGRFRDSCTYTVTDSADESFSRVVQVEVAGDGPSLPSVPPIDLTVGTNRSVALPQAEDGVAPYTYSFTCAGGQLPPGMSFAPSPPVFAGTPDGRFRDSCTYTVTDSADESFSRVVQVEVAGDGPSLPSVPPPRPSRTWRFVHLRRGTAAAGDELSYSDSAIRAPSGERIVGTNRIRRGALRLTRIRADTDPPAVRDAAEWRFEDSSIGNPAQYPTPDCGRQDDLVYAAPIDFPNDHFLVL